MKTNVDVDKILELLDEGFEVQFKPEPRKTKMRDERTFDWKVYRTTQYKEKESTE